MGSPSPAGTGSRFAKHRLLFLALCAWCATSGAARAQEPVEATAAQEPQEALWRFVKQDTELVHLIDACVVSLGLNVDYDRSKIEGTVNLELGHGVTDQGLWSYANRALLDRGLTCVQMPGAESLSVVPVEKAQSLARLEPTEFAGSWAGYVKVLVPLHHADSKRLVETVRAILTKEGGTVAGLPDSNSLLISDLKPHVEQAVSLLRRLDVPDSESVLEEVPVQNLSPITLVALIEQIQSTRKAVEAAGLRGNLLAHPAGKSVLVIAPADDVPRWRGLVERFDRREALVTRDYMPRRFGVRETAGLLERAVHGDGAAETPGTWKLVTDELTGTLIVTTTPSRHEEIERLFERLESTESRSRGLRSFPVRHRSVEDLLELLQGFLEAKVLDSRSPAEVMAQATEERPRQGPTAPLTGLPVPAASSADAEPKVTLAADLQTNRIVAMGEPRLLDQLGELIETLDVRGPQVLVETLVVTLSEADTLDLGVELQKLGTSDDVQFKLASLFGLGSPDPEAVMLPAATGTGFSAVTLDPGSFSGVVRALATVNEGRNQTIPKVLVGNNQQASLHSVLQRPFLTTNASNTVATTSFGGTQDAGTQITVRPQIAEGDQLVLDYSVSISTFTGESTDPELPPPRQENLLESVVTIPDGYTIVVGGLEVETETEATSKVPLLGDIPIVGALFRSRSTSWEKSRFYVFLRCSVLRHQGFEDLRHVSGERMRELSVDDGWPTLEPRVIR